MVWGYNAELSTWLISIFVIISVKAPWGVDNKICIVLYGNLFLSAVTTIVVEK